MKILKIISQSRRDFSADIECEGCENKEVLYGGYDDRNYHDNVLPNRKCKKCGLSSKDLGVSSEPTPTKYSDFEVV